MEMTRSDARFPFGATGGLAYKKIFPTQQAMMACGKPDMPIISMARAWGWTVDGLRDCAKNGLEHNGGVDADVLARLSAQLRFVDRDYREPPRDDRLK